MSRFPGHSAIIVLVGFVLASPAFGQLGGGGGVSCMMCFMTTCQETGTDSGWEGCRVRPTTFCRPSDLPGEPPRCKDFDACETFGENCLEPGSGGPTYVLGDLPTTAPLLKNVGGGRAVPPPRRIGDHILLGRHMAITALVYDQRVPPVLGAIVHLGVRLGPTQGYITETESTPDGVALGARNFRYRTETTPVDTLGSGYTMTVTFAEVDRRGRDLDTPESRWQIGFDLIAQRVALTEETGAFAHFEVDASTASARVP